MIGRTPEEARFREQRRSALLASGSVSGLDFVEARPHPGGEPVWRLRLHFLPSRPQGLATGSFRVVGPAGEVDPDVQVTRIGALEGATGGLDLFLRVGDPKRAARLRTESEVYRLEVDSPGLDRFFSSAPFRFDGRPAAAGAAAETAGEVSGPGRIDYLAKDYASLRQVMLERMAASVPEWAERNPADLGVAIVEVLAYAADHLSYYQDAVATEAYLDTARKRSSVRRHLRLLGHHLHEGCNARVWVTLRLNGNRRLDLPAGTALLTRAGDLPELLFEGSPQLAAALAQGSLTFETMHPSSLRPGLDRLPVHTWGAADYALPRGATSVALAGHFDELEAGDVLILELAGAAGGEEPDPRRRHPVRLKRKPTLTTDPVGSAPITELELFDEDALPFALAGSRGDDGRPSAEIVARGNVVLADHGRTVREILPPVADDELYRPALSSTRITRCEPFDPAAARVRAAGAISQRPDRALAQVTLFELAGGRDEIVGEPWRSRRDLLQSRPFSTHFVAETENDNTVRLRFGDGRQGRRPAPGTRFLAVYRVGNGPSGHIGHDSIAHLVSAADLPVASVENPLPAHGAEAAEPLERARLVAPRAFRRTESCVTPADLRRLAESEPEVLRAVAEPRWTGSWETLYLFVQRAGGGDLTSELESRLRALIEPRLLAGADLEIRPPGLLALEIHLRAVIEPGAVPEAVRAALVERLGCGDLDGGRRGHFHPDSFTFGQPAYLDGVLDEAMRVPGVVSVEAERFRSRGAAADGAGVLSSVEPGPLEIVCLRNRPAEPEMGILTVALEGGA